MPHYASCGTRPLAASSGRWPTTPKAVARHPKPRGKLLLWAGWNDPLWSQQNIVEYYESVVAINARDHGHHHGHHHWDPKPVGSPLERTKRFARLFMAPGVGHCGGGDGPNVFDTFAPLVQWVESGTPPERIVATKFVNNQASQGVALTHYVRTLTWHAGQAEAIPTAQTTSCVHRDDTTACSML